MSVVSLKQGPSWNYTTGRIYTSISFITVTSYKSMILAFVDRIMKYIGEKIGKAVAPEYLL